MICSVGGFAHAQSGRFTVGIYFQEAEFVGILIVSDPSLVISAA